MNPLSVLPLKPFDDFSIKLGKIQHGWMEITLETTEKSFEYVASYISDPLNDLLEATVHLLTNQPPPPGYNQRLRKDNAFFVHDTEEIFIVWLLHYSNGIFTISIWDNIIVDVIDQLCYYELDREMYNKYADDELPDLTNDLIFAFTGSPIVFAQKLKDVFDYLDATYTKAKKRKEWGIRYSKENYNMLTQWLAENTQ